MYVKFYMYCGSFVVFYMVNVGEGVNWKVCMCVYVKRSYEKRNVKNVKIDNLYLLFLLKSFYFN